MVKKAIILLGMPGAGKSTLASLISKNTLFVHVEYDMYGRYVTEYNNIIFDAFIETTEDLEIVLDKYKGFQITLINLNIDKNRCLENIEKRDRGTIDITNINLDYNIGHIIKEYNINYIQVDNYKVVTNLCNTDQELNTKLIDIINRG